MDKETTKPIKILLEGYYLVKICLKSKIFVPQFEIPEANVSKDKEWTQNTYNILEKLVTAMSLNSPDQYKTSRAK